MATPLLSLPDELIVEIMTHMSTSDAVSLAVTCTRLESLLCERCLWRHVHLATSARGHLSAAKLLQLLRHLHEDTRSLTIRGHVRRFPHHPPLQITPTLLEVMRTKCEDLKELRLEHCLIDASQVSLCMFPAVSRLRRLSLAGCDMRHFYTSRRSSFLSGSADLAAQLTELSLCGCRWLPSHALLSLSKLPQLRRLCLRGCWHVGGHVCYSALAAVVGFRHLQCLDVRSTSIDDSDVASFSKLPALNSLLLEPLRAEQLSVSSLLASLSPQLAGQLQLLALRSCRLSAGEMQQLYQLSNLRRLDLRRCEGSGVSQPQLLDELRRQLPQCQVLVTARHDDLSGHDLAGKRRAEDEACPSASKMSRTDHCAPHGGRVCDDHTRNVTDDAGRHVAWCLCDESPADQAFVDADARPKSSADLDETAADTATPPSSGEAPVVIVLNMFVGASADGEEAAARLRPPEARLAGAQEAAEILAAARVDAVGGRQAITGAVAATDEQRQSSGVQSADSSCSSRSAQAEAAAAAASGSRNTLAVDSSRPNWNSPSAERFATNSEVQCGSSCVSRGGDVEDAPDAPSTGARLEDAPQDSSDSD